MRLVELETPDVRRDPRAALQRAIDDVPLAEAAHKRAEDRVAKAEEERLRLLKVWRSINDELRATSETLAATKRRWLESSMADAADAKALREYRELRERKEGLVDRLTFLANYAQEDNERESLFARIAERGAYADLRESEACRQRLGVIANAASSFDFDPGAAISFPEDSWSARAAKEAADIRSNAVKGLEDQLTRHDAGVAARRDLIAGRLFS
jgi:hypothetical protein